MRAARVFPVTALALVVVAVVQVGWWLFDQHKYATATEQSLRTLYEREVSAASDLLRSGTPGARVEQLLPGVKVERGRAILAPDVSKQLADERLRRLNQYVWESAFFLVALGACIAVIWRVLRAEAQVRHEQDSFLALVSHQFKTPLASLQLSLETMSLRNLNPEQSRALIERMLADLSRMETMVSRILDSVRLERGRVELKREPVELSSAVARLVSQFEERLQKDRIVLSSKVPHDLIAYTDALAVDVSLRNLLENAAAAVAPVGGGSITISGQRSGTEVELTVRDSGVGFDPADQERLFQKFARLHPGGGSSPYGTGLGLFIVKRTMQLAGGRVRAHSEGLGRGAEFALAWPAASPEQL